MTAGACSVCVPQAALAAAGSREVAPQNCFHPAVNAVRVHEGGAGSGWHCQDRMLLGCTYAVLCCCAAPSCPCRRITRLLWLVLVADLAACLVGCFLQECLAAMPCRSAFTTLVADYNISLRGEFNPPMWNNKELDLYTVSCSMRW